MNPLFRKLYKHKRSRARDPNAPPPPNLFSTNKELKIAKSAIESQEQKINRLERQLELLNNRNKFLQLQVMELSLTLRKNR